MLVMFWRMKCYGPVIWYFSPHVPFKYAGFFLFCFLNYSIFHASHLHDFHISNRKTITFDAFGWCGEKSEKSKNSKSWLSHTTKWGNNGKLNFKFNFNFNWHTTGWRISHFGTSIFMWWVDYCVDYFDSSHIFIFYFSIITYNYLYCLS